MRALKGAVIVFTLALTAQGALAQHSHYTHPSTLPAAQISTYEQERRKLFAQMQRQPQNMTTAFAYAGLSAQLGDLEAAASTYEAVLVQNPTAGRVRLDLAATYYRLGAMSAARQNFERVLAEPSTPPAVRENITRYLTAIDRKQQTTNGFSGSFSFGMRHQSNPNASPNGDTITLNGRRLSLSEASRKRADVSSYLTANILHRMALGEGGHGFLTSLSLATTDFRKVRALRNSTFELSLGPEFAIASLGPRGGFISLQALISQSRLGGADYLTGKGISANLRAQLTQNEHISLQTSWRSEVNDVNELRPTAGYYDGDRWRVALNYIKRLSQDWQMQLGLRYDRRTAELKQNAYRELSATFGINHRLQSPFKGMQPWTIGLQTSLSRRKNDAANPIIKRDEPQKGTEYMVQAVQTMPLQNGLALQVFAGTRGINSNYDTRDFDDHYIGFSLMKRF